MHFRMPKIDNGWTGLMMKEFDKILQTIQVFITGWGTFLTSMLQNVMEAHKLKENKAKAVRHKGACHSKKNKNFHCKIILEDVEHPIPVSYINIYKALKYCVLATLNI